MKLDRLRFHARICLSAEAADLIRRAPVPTVGVPVRGVAAGDPGQPAGRKIDLPGEFDHLFGCSLSGHPHCLRLSAPGTSGRVFSSSRLLGTIEGSPVIRRVLLRKKGRKPQVMNLRFANGSEVYVARRVSHGRRGARAGRGRADRRRIPGHHPGWAARHRRDAQPLADVQIDPDGHAEINRQPSRGGLFPVDRLRMAGSVS